MARLLALHLAYQRTLNEKPLQSSQEDLSHRADKLLGKACPPKAFYLALQTSPIKVFTQFCKGCPKATDGDFPFISLEWAESYLSISFSEHGL